MSELSTYNVPISWWINSHLVLEVGRKNAASYLSLLCLLPCAQSNTLCAWWGSVMSSETSSSWFDIGWAGAQHCTDFWLSDDNNSWRIDSVFTKLIFIWRDCDIDGCVLLRTVTWPFNGTIEDFVDNFCETIICIIYGSNVNLVFDRYYDHSSKSATRKAARTSHELNRYTPLTSHSTALTNRS